MRVLAITKLFPNRREPLAAAFNRQQFTALGQLCQLDVVATIPWYPTRGWLSGRGDRPDVPRRDRIAGLDVSHPRLLYVPKLHTTAAALCVGSLLPEVLPRRGEVDVVLGSWAYPHGVAAVALARWLRVPAVIKLHGSDMNVIARMAGPRWHLRWALPRARRVAAVSAALGARAVELGARPERVERVMNGVDGDVFFPGDREAARAALGVRADAPVALYVGWLERTKGVVDLADAFVRLRAALPGAELVYVGDGTERGYLEDQARQLDRGSGGGITLAGALPLPDVARWMAACDVLCLPSWNEGTPNVVLEALASGRRVVATDVGGIPDLITGERLGELVPRRRPRLLANALERALTTPYDPEVVAAEGSPGTWRDSAARLFEVLKDAVAEGP